MRDRRLLEPHELPILVLGVLCGIVTAVSAVWFVLRTGIADELDLGVSILIGVVIGSVVGSALVAAARRATALTR